MAKKKTLILYGLVVGFLVLGSTGLTGSVETGKIHGKIMCADMQHSYTLYLPPGYTKDKKWPVIFFLEAAKRSKLPVERFKDAAETYGYILACSNEFEDGPYEANNRAMLAMYNDVLQRFAVDKARMYGSGFSGGARGATRLHYMTQKSLAGIIACGAGLDVRLKPEHISSLYFIVTISFRDFNYKEMMRLEPQLAENNVENAYLLFKGYHRWPDASDCTRTVEWLELQAMKKKTRPLDKTFIDKIYKKELELAAKLEKENDVFPAARGYELCVKLFKPLRDVPEAEAGYKRMVKTKAYKSFMKKEKRRSKEEWEYISRFARAAQQMQKVKVTKRSPGQFKKTMGMSYLRGKADQKKDDYDAAFAERLFIEVIMKFSRAGGFYIKQKEYKRAALYLELAFMGTKRNYSIPYQLAQVYSLDGETKKALKYLKIAVERGYKDKKAITNDKALDKIKNKKAFKELIDSI